MIVGRRLERELRGSSLIRPMGIGWPLLSAAKTILDLKQLWQNRFRLAAQLSEIPSSCSCLRSGPFLGRLRGHLEPQTPELVLRKEIFGLFVTQCSHRIDACSAQGRNERCDQRSKRDDC